MAGMSCDTEKAPPTDLSPSIQQLKRPSLLITLAWRIEDAITDLNWKHVAYKTCAFSYLALMMWVCWWVLPIPGHWPNFERAQSDKVPIVYQDFSNYFGRFEGFAECGVRARDLYKQPPHDALGKLEVDAFCPNRQTLLQALLDGGRIGFDAPYQPKDCSYRWYSVDEVCFILDRFDGVAFVGDANLQSIYNGFNIILRQDLALGSLRSWEMDQSTRDQCRCDSQFASATCAKYYVTAIEEVVDNAPSFGSPYFCKRTPHAMLHIEGSPVSPEVVTKFKSLVPQAPRSKYKPIPIIHSLAPTHFTQEAANQSLLEILALADESQRKTPMLWIGPTAPGPIGAKDRKGVQEVWAYDREMAKAATQNDIEVLKLYNMTVQANTCSGGSFGERVAITQAMMVINWLSRLESS